MLKSVATEICARRLGVAQGRAAALVQMASNAAILPKAVGSSRPDLTADELALLFLAIAVDRGMGNVGRTVPAYAGLTTGDGLTLAGAITAIIRDTPTARATAAGALIIHLDLPRATLLAAGQHHVFGVDEPHGKAGRHVAIPGAALAAMALELQGARPEIADELAGITRRSA